MNEVLMSSKQTAIQLLQEGDPDGALDILFNLRKMMPLEAAIQKAIDLIAFGQWATAQVALAAETV